MACCNCTGNGKTLLAKALASEAKVTFFNISASSLTSKWVGEGEKLVRALFQVANEMQPSIIFIDEIDSILSARTANENDAMRRLKTEILVQFDGVASGSGNVVVIGATNRPQVSIGRMHFCWAQRMNLYKYSLLSSIYVSFYRLCQELDDAARRRLVKRIYIPLPDAEARKAVVESLFSKQPNSLSRKDIQLIVNSTEGYSASDLTALCREAAMVAIRELGTNIASIRADKLRPVSLADIQKSLLVIRPSVTFSALLQFEEFTKEFGVQ